jgi:hypothetical protein
MTGLLSFIHGFVWIIRPIHSTNLAFLSARDIGMSFLTLGSEGSISQLDADDIFRGTMAHERLNIFPCQIGTPGVAARH